MLDLWEVGQLGDEDEQPSSELGSSGSAQHYARVAEPVAVLGVAHYGTYRFYDYPPGNMVAPSVRPLCYSWEERGIEAAM